MSEVVQMIHSYRACPELFHPRVFIQNVEVGDNARPLEQPERAPLVISFDSLDAAVEAIDLIDSYLKGPSI
jgi:hypothetical protein